VFNKRLVWSKKSIWWAIAILVIIPIVVNALMFIPVGKAVSTNSVWVGFFGSYIGSILSGLFTLLGVMMTINDLKNREQEDKLPKQLMAIDDLIAFISHHSMVFDKIVQKKLSSQVTKRIDYTLEGPDGSEGLLKLASAVNLNTYKTVRKLHDSFTGFRKPNLHGITIFTESDVMRIYRECIDGLKLEKQKIENKIN